MRINKFYQFVSKPTNPFAMLMCPFVVSPAGVNGGYYQGGTLPVQQAHSTTPHEAPHTVAPSAAPPTPQPQPPAGPVIPHSLVSTNYN